MAQKIKIGDVDIQIPSINFKPLIINPSSVLTEKKATTLPHWPLFIYSIFNIYSLSQVENLILITNLFYIKNLKMLFFFLDIKNTLPL